MLHEMDGKIASLLAESMYQFPAWKLFQASHPGWDIRYRPMNVDESIDWRRKIITLALWLPNPLFRTLHGMCHVDEHAGARGRPFADCEELQADEYARFWLIINSTTAAPRDLEGAA
jgi:hypothetical protein